MKTSGGNLIQAVEWVHGMPVSSGTYVASLIHCVEDGQIKAKFPNGEQTRDFVAGDDFVLADIEVEVLSGKFDIN